MSDTTNSEHPANLTKQTRLSVLLSLALSIFGVIFLWGFWSQGVFALGVNSFVYLTAALALFVRAWRRENISLKANAYWLVPIGLIILSFLIYGNPFMKLISLLVLPVSFALFYNFSFLSEPAGVHWHFKLVSKLVFRSLSVILSLGESVSAHLRLNRESDKSRGTARRIVLGVALFLIIAMTIVIPLLSSADAAFAGYVDSLLHWFRNLLSETVVYRTLSAAFLSVLTLAALLAWGKPFTFTEKSDDNAKIDSIVAGIVLGGTLALYLFFLAVQAQQLWVDRLPSAFQDTEKLVKGGFWQLLFLTAINIAIYFFTYRKTNPTVQKILFAFMSASLLLLLSAGRRIALYVTYYGFSYEKIYAAYAVLFCAILSIYLISRLFIKRRSDIFKFLLVLFVWMFGIISVFPVEQFILRTNVALVRLENSKIRLYEMTMLGTDVLGTVERYERAGLLTEKNSIYDREQIAPDRQDQNFDWQPWIQQQQKQIEGKSWYEKTLTDWWYVVGK